MKVVGSFLIVISFTFFGRMSAEKILKRVKYLKIIINILKFIKIEILYNKDSIFNIAKKLNESDGFKKLDFINNFYNNFLKGNSVKNAWVSSIKMSNMLLGVFNKSDIEEIGKIGNWLGGSDVNGQIASIDLTSEHLKVMLKEAEENKKKYVKVCNNLGILLGLALVILIW